MAKFKPTGSGMERARLAAGLTVAEVAAALTRHPASIRGYERGTTTPPQAVLLAMARLYGGCSVSVLVGSGVALPGAGDAVAFLRAYGAGDRAAAGDVLVSVHDRGFVAIAALAMNLAEIAQLAGGDLGGLLDTVHAQLVEV